MLPTTSSAASAAASAARDLASRIPPAKSVAATTAGAPTNADQTAAQFEGLLWSSVLAPLSQSLGPLGDVLTNALGTSAAAAQHDAFYARLRALIELSDAGAHPASDDSRP